jgi:hypothetical protein
MIVTMFAMSDSIVSFPTEQVTCSFFGGAVDRVLIVTDHSQLVVHNDVTQFHALCGVETSVPKKCSWLDRCLVK